MINRKGARKGTDIPHEVLNLLNQGEIESVNLTEWLAVNHMTLIQHVLSSAGLDHRLGKYHLRSLNKKLNQE